MSRAADPERQMQALQRAVQTLEAQVSQGQLWQQEVAALRTENQRLRSQLQDFASTNSSITNGKGGDMRVNR